VLLNAWHKSIPTLSLISLVVPLAASGNINLLEKLYTTVRTEDIVWGGNLLDRFANDISIYDAKPLGNLVKQYYNDQNLEVLFNSGKEVFVLTTCLQTAESVAWSTQEPPVISDHTIIKAKDYAEFRRAIVASANQPVFMQPVEVREGANPIRQYVDGGVRDYIGIQLAIDAGADEIFAIALSPDHKEDTGIKYNKTFPILQRTMEIFTDDVGENDIRLPRLYNKALRYIAAVKQKMISDGISQAAVDAYFNVPLYDTFSGKKPIRIHHIKPDEPLGGGPGGLEFDPQKMLAMLQKGEAKIGSYMAALPGTPGGNV
jgi:predicted acylesterase/phospholipase RssA